MMPPAKSHLTHAAMAVVLLLVLIQAYLFETVLEAVLDGQRAALPGALAVSAVLSAVALFLAFKAPSLDRRK
jgi:predicted Co/Zn/Cd cation transporter (cation efflux family)